MGAAAGEKEKAGGVFTPLIESLKTAAKKKLDKIKRKHERGFFIPQLLQKGALAAIAIFAICFEFSAKSIPDSMFSNGVVPCRDNVPEEQHSAMLKLANDVLSGMDPPAGTAGEKQWFVDVNIGSFGVKDVQQLDRYINCSAKAQWLHPTNNIATFWLEGEMKPGVSGVKRIVRNVEGETYYWEQVYMTGGCEGKRGSGYVCNLPANAELVYNSRVQSPYPLFGTIYQGQMSAAVIPDPEKGNILRYKLDFQEQRWMSMSLVGRVFNKLFSTILWAHDRIYRAQLVHHYEVEARITAQLLPLI